MGKNGGGHPTGTILTLEEALMRFKRKRSEAGTQAIGAAGVESSVHHADFSTGGERMGAGGATGELGITESASVSAHRDDANAEMSADDDIVALIDGIPRTLAELERIAAAEKAYDLDFPESTLHTAEAEEDGRRVATTM